MISPEALLRVAVVTGILASFLSISGGSRKSLTPGPRVLLPGICLQQELTRSHEGVSEVGARGRDCGPAVTVSTP